MFSITQQDLEILLKESEQIANDWNTFVQFRQNREAVLKDFMAENALN